MSMDSGEGFSEEGVMLLGISDVDRIEFFWLVTGFWNGQGLFGLVNDGVCGTEPGESEDDVFSSTAHDIEEVLLDNPFDVCV